MSQPEESKENRWKRKRGDGQIEITDINITARASQAQVGESSPSPN